MKRARMSVCLRVCVRGCEEEGARVGVYVCVSVLGMSLSVGKIVLK